MIVNYIPLNFLDLLTQPWILVFTVPLLGAFLTPIWGKIDETLRNWMSVFFIMLSATLSFSLLLSIPDEPTMYIIEFIPINVSASGNINFLQTAILLDPLSIYMACIASILSFLIALFSIEYMKEDPNLTRYWIFIQLFVSGMVLLVLAGDIILLFIGWKLVGICSYFLIGHMWQKSGEDGQKAAKSGIKAFLMTFIGDMCLLAALGILWVHTGTVNIVALTNQAQGFAGIESSDIKTIIALFILIGAISKSAQFPFITWLSSSDNTDIDAMQGPTTVSALIHAATMVKAGVYLMSRFFFVFVDVDTSFIFELLAIIVAITMVITALSALVTQDLKRVLAYSTVSQLAYMFLGIAVASIAFSSGHQALAFQGFLATQFHLLSHALFKALLFLTAGGIIHSLAGVRDLRKMGGLRKELPVQFWSMLIGVVALSGIFFNGFFSKEALLGVAFKLAEEGSVFGWLLFVSGVLTAMITAAYAFRMFCVVFLGAKNPTVHIHKPGLIINGVLIILSTLVVLTMVTGPFLSTYFEPMIDYFTPANQALIQGFELQIIPHNFLLTIFIVTLILSSAGTTYYLYGFLEMRHFIVIEKYGILKWGYTIIYNGFYLDSIYTRMYNWGLVTAHWMREFQTGDLNYNLSYVAAVFLFLLAIFFLS